MVFPMPNSERVDQDALASARQTTFQDNLAYLHANIGYYMNLDVDQSEVRLEEISALIEVLLDQSPGGIVS
ncbi:MAG: hypothetical protein VB862_11770 [Pirellulaceae bacterium]